MSTPLKIGDMVLHSTGDAMLICTGSPLPRQLMYLTDGQARNLVLLLCEHLDATVGGKKCSA